MTIVVFALLGGAIGLAMTGGANGALGGLALGVLAGWVSGLSRRIEYLERQLAALTRAPKTDTSDAPARAPAPAAGARPAAPQPPPAAAPAVAAASTPSGAPSTASAADAERAAAEMASMLDGPATAAAAPAARESAPLPAAPAPAITPHEIGGIPPARPASQSGSADGAAAAAASRARAARRAAPVEPSPLDQAFDFVKRWFTTGNVPVKVGVVLSVFGVGFLVKEGIDRGVLALPLEVRLMFVALFGIALLVLGWRLRNKNRNYALSVQGGGIAVLYLTIYSSFDIFHLLPAGAAFALLLVITVASGALAVLQDSRELAVLGIIGGFMAPVLASDGGGNHVALFGYYAVLNVAIVGIAWFKAWRELNVLGFLFTFGIGALWGYQQYTPENFATTEPFLILFVLMYIAIPVLFASRQAPDLKGFVDGTLTFGTPFVGFGLQWQLVGDTEYGLAISALALAALYVSVATFLLRRAGEELRVMVESQFALAVAFLTVAIPLALDARWTSAAWAMQGAAMVWLGFRQHRRLALAAGIVLQLMSGAAYFNQSRYGLDGDLPIVNGLFLGTFLLALAGGFSGRLFERAPPGARRTARAGAFELPLVSAAFLLWAGGWWFGGGFAEIDRFVQPQFGIAARLLFVAASTLLVLPLAARIAWGRLEALGLVLWPAALLLFVGSVFEVSHPAGNLGFIAWPAVLAAMLVFLRAREDRFALLSPLLHVSGYWLTGALLAWEIHWQMDRVAYGIWPTAVALAAGAAFVIATLAQRKRIAWPLARHEQLYVKYCTGGAVAALVVVTVALNMLSPGDAEPLPYVPLLNPLELVSVLVCVSLLHWLAIVSTTGRGIAIAPRQRAAVAALFGWYLLTMAVARAVHHFAGVPFDVDSLAQSMAFQSSLSIVWGATALTAMVIGARRRRRIVWLAGATLMGVVVVKLFLVELGSSGTIARIVSFLGVGLLLLVVGYFAPVPPRAEVEKAA